jgi:membrane fusion protein, multidrug efflux system
MKYLRLSLLLSLLISLMVGCAEKEVQITEKVRLVRYEQVFSSGQFRERTFSCIAQSSQESAISFKVPGTIEKIHVKIGDKVGIGDLIAELDDANYSLQVQQAEAALEQAHAQERNAKATYNRVRALYENQNVSKSDLDASRAGSESAAAAVRAGTKQLDLAKLQQQYTHLKAPVSGTISELPVEVNESTKPGDLVLKLSSGNRPEVKVNIPEVLIGDINVGDEISVAFNAFPDKPYAAKVTEVGVASTMFATTFVVTVQLNDATPEIRPGMAAEAMFKFSRVSDLSGVMVPTVAVGEDNNGRYVFVVEPTSDGFGVARRVTIVLGDLTGDGLEVISGLVDGDLVITAGITRIVDGQKIRLL